MKLTQAIYRKKVPQIPLGNAGKKSPMLRNHDLDQHLQCDHSDGGAKLDVMW